MLPFINIEEQAFDNLKKLRDVIANQDRRDYELPIQRVSLREDGTLQAGKFKGPLIRSALCGLLKNLRIPLDFALYRCPQDLLLEIVRRMAKVQDTVLRINTIDGVVTGIMPADRQPIRHDILVDCLGVERPVKEATLGIDCLRITAITTKSRELLPDDTFACGWELMNRESGWQSTEMWRWVVREKCSNGIVGLERNPIFRRPYNSREPTLKALKKLVDSIQEAMSLPELEPAIRWAADKRIGKEYEFVVNYLVRKLEGDATKQALDKVTAETSWYELMNIVTYLAKLHRIDMRRRYEAEGGILLNWFSIQGRGRPPWRQVYCEECKVWSTN
ncbi:hypothetical protein ACFL5F_03260 [Planctomycetota bacterium]